LHIEALAAGVGFSPVGKLGVPGAGRGVFVDFELEGALFEFADAVEVVFEAIFGGLAEGGVVAGVVAVLLEDGIEDAALESFVEVSVSLNAAKDAGEEVDGALLHGGGDGAVGLIRMHVAADAAAAKKGAADESGDDAIGLAFGVVGFAEELIERSAPGAGLAIRRGRGEGGGGAVEVGIDAGFIGADVVDSAHDEKFVGERFEGLHDAVESFLLERGGDAESEEEIEGPHGDGFVGGKGRGGHFFEEGKSDGGAGEAAEKGASVHGIIG